MCARPAGSGLLPGLGSRRAIRESDVSHSIAAHRRLSDARCCGCSWGQMAFLCGTLADLLASVLAVGTCVTISCQTSPTTSRTSPSLPTQDAVVLSERCRIIVRLVAADSSWGEKACARQIWTASYHPVHVQQGDLRRQQGAGAQFTKPSQRCIG